MNSNEILLSEYLELSYNESKRISTVKDFPIENYILLRETYNGSTIYYLTSGSSLFIPWSYIDIFTGFFCYAWDRLNKGDQIYTLTKICGELLNKFRINGKELLSDLGTLVENENIDSIRSAVGLQDKMKFESVKESIYI